MKLYYSSEVAQALNSKKAIVALESTIIAHGMPYPDNVNTAKAVEEILREEGAVPATIAILDGKMHVGLEAHELELLGTTKSAEKVSIRDLPYVLSQQLHGATTVAATMRIAHMAGLAIFVTGGIGGVHREAAQSFDISADLTEMARNPVAVVSAGVKSILDIAATLEVLETLGVPVLTYAHDYFPNFYSRNSPYRSPFRMDDVNVIADLIRTKNNLGLQNSVLIANPVPEEFEIPYEKLAGVIDAALQEAANKKITGKACTPFLLKKVAELTAGNSLQANIALIKNNAKLGARIARSLYQTV